MISHDILSQCGILCWFCLGLLTYNTWTHKAGGPRWPPSHAWLAVGHGNQLGGLSFFHVSLFSYRNLDWISYAAAPTQRSKEARHNAQIPFKPLLATCLLMSRGPKTVAWPAPEWMWGQIYKLWLHAVMMYWMPLLAESTTNGIGV